MGFMLSKLHVRGDDGFVNIRNGTGVGQFSRNGTMGDGDSGKRTCLLRPRHELFLGKAVFATCLFLTIGLFLGADRCLSLLVFAQGLDSPCED